MRWAALLALVALAACSDQTDRSITPTSATTDRSTTTEALTPDEAFLADLHDRVDFDNPEWGERAIALAEQVCGSLSAGQTITDVSATDSFVDMTLSAAYGSTDDDAATAAVLVVGAEHFCPEWLPTVEDDAASRGLTPR